MNRLNQMLAIIVASDNLTIIISSSIIFFYGGSFLTAATNLIYIHYLYRDIMSLQQNCLKKN